MSFDSVTSSLSVPQSHWDSNQSTCSLCKIEFTLFRRRHHCRRCGRCVCDGCSPNRINLEDRQGPSRVCIACVGIPLPPPASGYPTLGAEMSAASQTDVSGLSLIEAGGEIRLEKHPQSRISCLPGVVSQSTAQADARRMILKEFQGPDLVGSLLDEVMSLRKRVQTLTENQSMTADVVGNMQQPLVNEPPAFERSSTSGSNSFYARHRNISDADSTTPLDGDNCYFEVTEARPHKNELGFPHSLGPFKLCPMSRIKPEHLEVFYDNSEDKLQWKFDSKIKLPPGSGDPTPGYLSPLTPITLSAGTRRAAGIPETAQEHAWFHPVFPHMKAHSFDSDLTFLKNGGFVYFDGSESLKAVHICALELDVVAGPMAFGPPKKLSKPWSDHLWAAGRFQPITIEFFLEQGATHFCWILNDEIHDGEKICPKGGFAYYFAPGLDDRHRNLNCEQTGCSVGAAESHDASARNATRSSLQRPPEVAQITPAGSAEAQMKKKMAERKLKVEATR